MTCVSYLRVRFMQNFNVKSKTFLCCSCYGQVTSLNGEPEPGVFVEALGQDSCSMYQEESKTETNGNYRIRGLQVTEVDHRYN